MEAVGKVKGERGKGEGGAHCCHLGLRGRDDGRFACSLLLDLSIGPRARRSWDLPRNPLRARTAPRSYIHPAAERSDRWLHPIPAREPDRDARAIAVFATWPHAVPL